MSVVVPMRNEAAQARACLASLASTDYAPVEFLIVDDRSSDDTLRIVREFAERDARFRAISLEHDPPPGWQGKPYAADAGIRASAGKFLIIADADVRHAPQSAAMSVAALAAADLAVALPRSAGRGPAAWCARYLYEMLYLASQLAGESFAPGAYAACSRDFYDRSGGWGTVKGHPEVMALAAYARQNGLRVALARRDDLSMEQYHSVGEASRALARNINYRLTSPRAAAWFAAILTLLWVGVSMLQSAPLFGAVMLLCYCGTLAYAWRRYGVLGMLGGFLYAVPGGVWVSAVAAYAVVRQAFGGAVSWRGRSFIR